jgi:hypothetical protein
LAAPIAAPTMHGILFIVKLENATMSSRMSNKQHHYWEYSTDDNTTRLRDVGSMIGMNYPTIITYNFAAVQCYMLITMTNIPKKQTHKQKKLYIQIAMLLVKLDELLNYKLWYLLEDGNDRLLN